MDSVNSTTFIKRPPLMTDTQEKFLYAKELLSNRIFLGYYQERRYISVLNEYRDVVVVSCEETDLLSDLEKLTKKLSGVKELKWVGITGPKEFGFPDSYCFCVKLTNLAFGQYWFQIKHVKLIEQTIFLHLKCIRKSQPTVHKVPTEVNGQTSGITVKGGESSSSTIFPTLDNSEFDPRKALSTFQETCIEAVRTVQPLITWKNFVLFVRVGCGLMIALVVGIISMIGHLGEFVLRLIREFSLLVNAFTPIVIQVIDLLGKIIGGFLILIARMFGNGHQPNFQGPRNKIFYSIKNSGENNVVDWRERNRNLRRELLSNSFGRT